MTQDEFSDLLDLYGADLSRWPINQRVAAQALLASKSGEVWQIYQAAQFIDQQLAQPAAAPSRALLDRILLASTEVAEPPFNFWALFAGWQRAMAGGAICASLMAGLYSGWSTQLTAYSTVTSTTSSITTDDIPGLTYAPGEVGEWQ